MNATINHAAIYTAQLERLRDFYCKYLGAVSNELYRNDKGFSSYFLTFTSGARLELMSHTELITREAADKMSGLSHLAFSLGSRENVTELTQRLVADGYKLYSPPRVTGDGYFESCVSDPDGNAIELTE